MKKVNAVERKEVKYNELIGRIGDEYYSLDYIFENGEMNGKPFKGACGSCFSPVTKEEADRRNEEARTISRWNEYVDFWRDSVAAGKTTDSFEDWIELVIDEADGPCISFDASYPMVAEKVAEKAGTEYAECTGGGRCFKAGMKWDELYRPDLLKLILEVESK